MLEILRKRRDDEGFTLIELMVVVLIIAILIAIAIPTFLGARQRAQDRAAQSNVRNAFTAEKTFYTDSQAYTELAADMTAIEPSLTYTAAVGSLSPSGNVVYLNVSTASVANDTIVIGAQSGSGKCFWLKDSSPSGTTYSTSTSCAAEPGAGTFTQTNGW
jgi:type IV pilus assembly protein PilA